MYLLHTPTLNELNSWVNRLPTLGNSGVSQLIAHSQEAVTRTVDSLYQQLLGRSADAGGEAAFSNSWATRRTTLDHLYSAVDDALSKLFDHIGIKSAG